MGTQLGDIRRYDTRAARRPVSNWVGISKVGGVGVVENGSTEKSVFPDLNSRLELTTVVITLASYSWQIKGAVYSRLICEMEKFPIRTKVGLHLSNILPVACSRCLRISRSNHHCRSLSVFPCIRFTGPFSASS